MKISTNTRLIDIKNEFHSKFPGLKIEFYKHPHHINEGSPASETLDENNSIEEVTDLNQSKEITLNNSWTVKELEDAFEHKFGLHAQVFRRSNDLWLQTTATDHWTLEVQNGKGIRSVQK